jgi:hypothetical protein
MKKTQDWPKAFNPDERYGGAMIGFDHEESILHMVRTMLEQCEQMLNALGAPPDARDCVVITIRRIKWPSAPKHCYVSWEYNRKKNLPYIMGVVDPATGNITP